MKKLIVIIVALYSSYTYAQDIISQQRISSNISSGCALGGIFALEDDPTFRYVSKKEWQLDQMYVNQTAQDDTLIANVSILLDLEIESSPHFLWVKKIGSDNVAKDYPVQFISKPKSGQCTLYQFKLFHKYSNNLLYTYTLMHASEATLVFTVAQQDAENATVFHTIEYRFVPKRN